MSDVLHLYQNTVAGEINRVEGYVAKLMGDGALAYFAVAPGTRRRGRAGGTGGFGDFFSYRWASHSHWDCIAVRVGIATGMVVVGDMIGAGAAREETAVGEALNLADSRR